MAPAAGRGDAPRGDPYAAMTGSVDREPVGQAESVAAQRAWWDGEAAEYYAEHGAFLGDDGFVWGPEGWTEEDLAVLARDGRPPEPVLEIGAGAGQCSRWLAGQGIAAVASDLSGGMLRQGAAIDARRGGLLPRVQADGARLPFPAEAFGTVFTAYGVLPFVADAAAVLAEAVRVLRPGGRFAFSTTHPIRWAFPDVPGAAGLTAHQSYFDTRPYVERDDRGRVTYVEHHRTLGDWVGLIVGAGLALTALIEPPWPERNRMEWGGWSPTRGRILPGTAIFVARKPG